MSDTATSGEAPVAPAETVSAPSWPVANSAQAPTAAQSPTFGTSRGSGLLRGKRPSAPATKSNDSNSNSSPAAPGAYQPTAVQVLTSESTYKNPFAPEPSVVAPSAPVVAVVETAPPAAPVVAPVAAPVARPAPQAEIKEITTADEPVGKVELNILPPEGKSRPAQSWESASFPSSGNQGQPRADQSARPQPQGRRDGGRVEDRPIFRTERARERMEQELRDGAANPGPSAEPHREQRENREPRQPRDPREQRQPRDPREQREPRQPRDPRDPREQRQPRDPREQRPFEKTPVTTPPIEAKKPAGFFGWLKNLFAEDTVSPPEKSPSAHPSAEQGQRRFDGGNGGGRRHERGGRGGYRGGNGNGGGGNRGNQPRAEGGQAPQAPQGEPGQQQHQGGGERRFDGAGGSGHRHRGGRGRGGRGGYRGGNGGNSSSGEGRSDSSSGPSS